MQVRSAIKNIGALAIISWLMVVGGGLVIRGSLSTPHTTDRTWLYLIGLVENAWYDSTSNFISDTMKHMFIYVAAFYVIWLVMNWSARVFIRWEIFGRSDFFECYLFMKEEIENKANSDLLKNFNKLYFIPFMMAALLLATLKILPSEIIKTLGNTAQQIIVWIVTLFTFAVSLFDVYYVVKARNRRRDISPYVLQRYLVWRLVRSLIFFIWILLFVQIGLPELIASHEQQVHRGTAQVFVTSIEEIRDSANRLITDEDEQVNKEAFFEWVDRLEMNAQNDFTLKNSMTSAPWKILPIMAELSAYCFIALIVAYFLWPFLILGQFTPAFLYISLLAFSYLVESLIEHYIPNMLFLPSGSLEASVLIFVLIASNTFLSDWIYGDLTEKTRLCLSCGQVISQRDTFCKKCGVRQNL